MARLVFMILMLLSASLPASGAQGAGETQGAEELVKGTSPGATDAEISATLSSGVSNLIRPPVVSAFSEDRVKEWTAKAKQAKRDAQTSLGDKGSNYDVIIQIGHFPRTKGKTGGTGAHINEQEAAAWVGTMLGSRLRDAGYKVILIPAGGYTRPLKTKIFLALHTDSSALPCSVGPSVGYGKSADATGMHGIALALAISLGRDPKTFMRDNYTKNLSGYYAYGDLDASAFEGVLEMSELSCPEDEEKLLSVAEMLALNLHYAVDFALRPASVGQ